MLRSLLIFLSQNRLAQKIVSRWGVAKRVASRFVAGETVSAAMQAARALNEAGLLTTLDALGENTSSWDQAEEAVSEILSLLDAINESQVKANVSVKLSQFGLTIDEYRCADNLERIVKKAAQLGIMIRIDMEDSSLTDMTLRVFEQMCLRGYKNVGVVIQAYLYRSEADVARIMEEGGRVRLCKGAYMEPADVAFPVKQDVDENYDKLAGIMLSGAVLHGQPPGSDDGRIAPISAFATHDIRRIRFVQSKATEMGIPPQAFEFQFLYGIRRDLQDRLVSEGYRVRVYVPYGTQWYPYFMRRLAERPANLKFFIRSLLGK